MMLNNNSISNIQLQKGGQFKKSMIQSNKTIRMLSSGRKDSHQDQFLQQHLRKRLSPLSKYLNYESTIKKESKSKKVKLMIKSTCYTSPSSYQSSYLVSKNQSRQKKSNFKNKSKDIDHCIVLMKKRKKRKLSPQKNKQNDKNNDEEKKIGNKIQSQSKMLKWKNKVLKQFFVQSHVINNNLHTINSLHSSLRACTAQSIKQKQSNSFFGYLLGDNADIQNKKISLIGSPRILIIDWMYLISASLLLTRQTVHLAIHYLDSYFKLKDNKEENQQKIHILAASALLLSVKQEQRELQSSLLSTMCMSEKYCVVKEQVLECQKLILTKLNFRLKSNTLAFWIDYFALKWDNFVDSIQGDKIFKQANFRYKIKLRSPDGQCYKLYRQLVQLSDVSLMFGDYVVFQKCKLSLACIYLVIRIQSQKKQKQNNPAECENIFKIYHKLFLKKASPIFKDPYRINQIFNGFLTQICQFQITQIIPCIKFIANFLQLQFSYAVDQKSLEQTKSYEDFIRRMTYSYEMKDYCLRKIQ